MNYKRGGMAAAYGVSRRKKMARGGLLPHEGRVEIPTESQEHQGGSPEENAREKAYSHLAHGGKAQKFIKSEMHKFGKGELHSGSKHGPKVSDPKQAIAIALSQAREKGMKVPHKHEGGEMHSELREKFLEAARKAKSKHMAKGGEIPKEDHAREYDRSIFSDQPEENQKLKPGTGEAPETAELDHEKITGAEYGHDKIDEPIEQQTGRHYLPGDEDIPSGMRGPDQLHHLTSEGHHPEGKRQESFEFSGYDQKAEDYRNMAEGGSVHEPEGPQHDHEFEHLNDDAHDYRDMAKGGSIHSPLTIAIGVRHAKKMAIGGELKPEYNYLSENDSYPDEDMREWETLTGDRLDSEDTLHADQNSHEYRKRMEHLAHGGHVNKIPQGNQDYPYIEPPHEQEYSPKEHYKLPHREPRINPNKSKNKMYAAYGGYADGDEVQPSPSPDPFEKLAHSHVTPSQISEGAKKAFSSTDTGPSDEYAEGGDVKKKKRLSKIMASLSGLGE